MRANCSLYYCGCLEWVLIRIAQEESTSAAVDNTKGLFDPKSSLFLNAVIISSVLLVVFSILGLLFEYCYLKPKKIMLLAARSESSTLIIFISLFTQSSR